MQSRILNRAYFVQEQRYIFSAFTAFVIAIAFMFCFAIVSQADAQQPQRDSRPEFIRSSSPTSGGGSVIREAVEGNSPTTFANVPVTPRGSERERAQSFYRQSAGVGSASQSNGTGTYPYPAGASATDSTNANRFGNNNNASSNSPAYTNSSQWSNTTTGELGNTRQSTVPRVADNRTLVNPTAFQQAANQAPTLGTLGLGPVGNGYNGAANRVAQVAQANCNCNPLPAPPTQLQYSQGYQAAPNYGYQQPQQPNCNCGPGGYAGGTGYAPNGYNVNAGGGGYALQSGIGVPQFGSQSSNWLSPFLTGSGQYTPLLNFRNMPPGTYLGQGLIGQPTAYVDGQPFRNLIRYISP